MALKKFLGLVDELQAVTYGEPGQRTFNITATSDRGTGTVWLEKEQLHSIAESLGGALSLISNVSEPSEDAREISERDEGQPGNHIEFKAWQIALQYDDRKHVFLFAAAGPDPDLDDEERRENPDAFMVQFSFSHEQAEELAVEGMKIVVAGRPICPYCSIAINQGETHQCHRRNGHSPDDGSAILDAIDEMEG